MKRPYNHNLSKEVNDQLNRRAQIVRRQKNMIAILCILLIAFAILLGTSMKAFASSKDQLTYHKYYTSIEVESGDTLWSIADQYMLGSNMDKQDYIHEICQLNNLQDAQIHSGDHLIVAYYSTDCNN